MKEILNIYKWWVIGIVFLLIFLSAKSCTDKKADVLSGENKILKQQTEILKDGLVVAERIRLKQKDSIRLEDIKRQEEQNILEQKVIVSQDKVKQLEKNNVIAKEKIKNLTLVSVAKELNTIYGGNNAVATSNSIDARGSLPYQLLETVSDANTSSEVIKEKNIQLNSKDSLIISKNEDNKALSLNLFSAENNLNTYKQLSQLQTDLNKNLEKENDKLKNKSWWNKMLIPIGAVAGYVIGAKIGK